MPKNRSRLEIIADVLRATKNNGKKTRIMYFANLSHTLLEKYLGKMVDAGLMSLAGNGYEVTEKGEVFLEKHGRFLSKCKKVDGAFQVLMSESEELESMCRGGDLKNKCRLRRRLGMIARV